MKRADFEARAAFYAKMATASAREAWNLGLPSWWWERVAQAGGQVPEPPTKKPESKP